MGTGHPGQSGIPSVPHVLTVPVFNQVTGAFGSLTITLTTIITAHATTPCTRSSVSETIRA